MKIEGVYTAIVTPFTHRDTIDEPCLRRLIQRQVRAHVNGVLVLGTTGESPTLDREEAARVIHIAKEMLEGHSSLIVGCGTNCTKSTIEQALAAKVAGADAIQIVTPYYNRPTQEGIYLHFQAVSRAVDLPICIYNIPVRTGQNIEAGTLLRLAKIPNIISVKETGGSILQMMDILEKVWLERPAFTVLSGDDLYTWPLMALGGHGVVSVLSNLLPRHFVKLVTAAKEGNMAIARALHYALKPAMNAAAVETNPAPIKYMMQCASLCSETCRLPLSPLSSQSKERIQQAIHAISHLLQEEVPLDESLP